MLQLTAMQAAGHDTPIGAEVASTPPLYERNTRHDTTAIR